MKVGDTFNMYGSHWFATHVEIDENERFMWLVVTAKWCGYGPIPLWHKEPERFLLYRRKKA